MQEKEQFPPFGMDLEEFLTTLCIIIERITAEPREELPDYSVQEWDALCEYREMTSELFYSCAETCSNDGNFKEFLELFERFPEQAEIWCENPDYQLDALNAFLEANNIDPQILSEDELQAHWTTFLSRIREESGDKVADLFSRNLFQF